MGVVKNIYTDIDLKGNELKNFRVSSLDDDPEVLDGGIYYNTKLKEFRVCIAGKWVNIFCGWYFDEEGNLCTDKQVIIRNNLIVEGDTSSGGEGEDTPSAGLDETKLQEYLDEHKYVTEDDIAELIPSNVATVDYVDSKFNSIDLSPYAKTTELNALANRVVPIETWMDNVGQHITYDAELDAIVINHNLIVTKDTSSGGEGEDTPSAGLNEEQLQAYLDEHKYVTEDDIAGLIPDVDLSNYYTKTQTDSAISTAIAELVNGAPTTLDTLKEIADALAENEDVVEALESAIGTKADKTINITAGTGLSGGGTLASNVTLSLATSGVTAGTYPKVTVDKYGRVTAGATLVAGDIPALAISKITGLQTELDNRYTEAEVNTLLKKYLLLEATSQTITGDITINGNLIVTGDTSSGGEGSDTPASGTVTGVTVGSTDYTDVSAGLLDLTSLMSRYTPLTTYNGLATKVRTLEGKATAVSFTQTQTSGTKIGAITIDGVSTNIYTPTIASLMGSSAIGGTKAFVYWTGSAWATKSLGDRAFDSTSYLPLSGGRITGNSLDIGREDNYAGAFVKIVTNASTSADYGTSIRHYEKSSGSYTYKGLLVDKNGAYYSNNGSNYGLIHSGNIGSQSVSHATTTNRFKYIASSGDLNTVLAGGGLARTYSNYMSNIFTNAPSGMRYGMVLQFSAASAGAEALSGQLAWDVNHASTSDVTRYLWWRASDSSNGFKYGKWHQIAFTDSNVASATKLQTARTIWGQSFDGTGDVSGTLYMPNNTNIKMAIADGTAYCGVMYLATSNNLVIGNDVASSGFNTLLSGNEVRLRYGISRTNGLILNSSGNVTIGASDLASTTAKLYVNGGRVNLVYSNTSTQYFGDNASVKICTANPSGYSVVLGLSAHTSEYCTIQSTKIGVGSMPLLLNPSGGNVLIGTTTDDASHKVQIAGTLKVYEPSQRRFYTRFSTAGVQCGVNTSLYTGGWNGGVTVGADNSTLGFVAGAYVEGSTISSYFYGGLNNGTAAMCINPSTKAVTMFGALTITGSIAPSANNSYTLGTSSYMWSTTYTRYIDTASGYVLRFKVAGTEYMNLSTAGYLCIGNGSSTGSEKLHVYGNAIITGDTSSGSDIRFKDRIDDMVISLKDMANAPLFTFKWNDREDEAIHLGSSAQYWEKVCPWLVTGEDFKTLNYGVGAMGGVISLARHDLQQDKKIKAQGKEIKALKRTVKELEKEIKRLKEEMRYGDR